MAAILSNPRGGGKQHPDPQFYAENRLSVRVPRGVVDNQDEMQNPAIEKPA